MIDREKEFLVSHKVMFGEAGGNTSNDYVGIFASELADGTREMKGAGIFQHNSYSINIVNTDGANSLDYKVVTTYDSEASIQNEIVGETTLANGAKALIEKNCAGRRVQVLVKSTTPDTPASFKVFIRLNPSPVVVV